MYHSITFDHGTEVYNTWDAFRLIPEQRPVFDSPNLSYAYYMGTTLSPLESYDLQRDFNRRAAPVVRKASWSFYAWHDEVSDRPPEPLVPDDYYHQPTKYSTIMQALHGRVCGIHLEDDPDYYYVGLVEVRPWEPGEHFSKITLEITAEPFKYKATQNVTFTGMSSYTLDADTEWYTPMIVTITPSANITRLVLGGFAHDKITRANQDIVLNHVRTNVPIVINGERKTITEDGANKFSDSEFWSFPSLRPGSNVLTLSPSSAKVDISYIPRWL